MPNLVHREVLLQNIANGLQKLEERKPQIRLSDIRVTFHIEGGEAFHFTLPQALDTIASDLFWDERGDWSWANRATVEVI